MKFKFNPISGVMDLINDLTNYYTKSEVEGLISKLLIFNINILNSQVVHNTGNENITGIKTFSDKIVASYGGIDTGSGLGVKTKFFTGTTAAIQNVTTVTLTGITYANIKSWDVHIDIGSIKIKSSVYSSPLYASTFSTDPNYTDHYIYTSGGISYLQLRTGFAGHAVASKPFTVTITYV